MHLKNYLGYLLSPELAWPQPKAAAVPGCAGGRLARGARPPGRRSPDRARAAGGSPRARAAAAENSIDSLDSLDSVERAREKIWAVEHV